MAKSPAVKDQPASNHALRDVQPYLYPALAIAATGVFFAMLLTWWTSIVLPTAQMRANATEAMSANLRLILDTRMTAIRDQVETLASSAVVRNALLESADAPAGIELSLTDALPHVKRITVYPHGRAQVDMSAAVPVNFAALDLINKAATQPYMGPVVIPVQPELLYTAAPITYLGKLAGELLVVFDVGYLREPFTDLPPDLGTVEVVQTLQGAPSTTVLQQGSSGDAALRVESVSSNPSWIVAFAPADAFANAGASATSLVAPLAVALVMVLGGIFLGFSRLARKLTADFDALQAAVASVRVKGRPDAGEMNFSSARALLANLGQIAAISPAPEAASQPASGGTASVKTARSAAKAAKGGQEKVGSRVNELLAASREDENTNDFLEVSPVPNARKRGSSMEVRDDLGPMELGLQLDPEIFRAYDIRGITNTNLTEDVVYWIARAFAAQALDQGRKRVVVGRDGRLSSSALRDALVRGLNEGGTEVFDIGEVPTPLLYFATHELETGTGIMITGSHNPPDYNGVKMVLGGVTLAEEALQKLKLRIEKNDLSSGQGSTQDVSITDRYIARVVGDVALADQLKVVVDCGNGVAGAVAPRLLEEMGCEVIPLYCEVDGNFPNHHPDPADPANLEDLITVVQAEGADLGIAFDGDGDRIGVVTNRGDIIWPDKLMMLFSQDIVGRNPGADIIYDVKCSRHLNTLISEYGGRPIMWKTGHSNIKAKLKETGALLAGEFSGHICFAERWFGFDDALYSAARLLEIISAENQPVDTLFAQFPVTFATPELKIKTTEKAKFAVMDRLRKQADFGEGTVTTIDGLRVDYADGWGLIRPSNTGPVLSLRFEADGQAALERIQDLFQKQLSAIDPSLQIR
ncbi:MAG: phosphomannomutase/phosphoglucomutase [Pseudomonadales bacterium]|nr:phosphomannomutase/phosphoglucomutase [Pseudomonadales bacterium]MCP5183442.1 phosphomannomutase/phosphoglucomutase [Pseudomonadales bacterium]